MFPFDHHYPGTDLHEIDLAYIIEEIKAIRLELKNFADVNKINYANPLEWSITTQYPAFTIVRDADTNNLYISMQPVPEGVSLDNSEYWQVVGIYSGGSDFLKWVISQNYEPDYRSATQSYAVNTYFWGADNNLYRVTRAVPQGGGFGPSNCHAVTVGDELTELHNTDASLQTQIDNISIDTSGMLPVRRNRKYIILMDSYGVNVGGETGINEWLTQYLGLNGDNSWTYPHSSARFGPNYPSNGESYIHMIQDYDSNIPKADITDIIVQTAGNDLSETTASWQNAMTQFINYCKTNFPNAQIRIAYTLFAYVRTSRIKKYTLCQDMKDFVIKTPNISWIENVEVADKDYGNYRDTNHPNSTGMSYFASSIANAILGESVALHAPHAKRCHFTESGTTDVTAWDTNNGIQSFQLYETVYIRFATNEFTISPIVITAPETYGDNWHIDFTVDLGRLDDQRFFGAPQSTVNFNIPNCAVMYQSLDGHSNQWRDVSSAYIYFEDDSADKCHAKLRFYLSNPGGPDIQTNLRITKIRFDNSDHYIPAMYV